MPSDVRAKQLIFNTMTFFKKGRGDDLERRKATFHQTCKPKWLTVFFSQDGFCLEFTPVAIVLLAMKFNAKINKYVYTVHW